VQKLPTQTIRIDCFNPEKNEDAHDPDGRNDQRKRRHFHGNEIP